MHVIRTYIQIGLFFYFKKIEVVKQSPIPKDKPVLFLANHQNALIDALLIVTTCGRFSYFLTRAAVFKRPLVSKLLHTLRMLPVYRIRDGWNTLTNNNAIFNTCTALLQKGEAVTIFPEGSHNINRTVRSLSKGFTRIIFETLGNYPETDLQLVPVGFNFIKAEGFPDQVSVYFGEAIEAKKVLGKDKNTSVNNLKSRVHSEISQLTTHIPSMHYESTLKRLGTLGADFLNPKAVNSCIAGNFSHCQFKKNKEVSSLLGKVVHVLFIGSLIVPYMIWKFIVKPKISEIEFMSTFRFVFALTLAPLWLLLLVLILLFLYGWMVTMGYVLFVLGIVLIRVKA